MKSNIRLSKREVNLITFLYEHRLQGEIWANEKEIVDYLKSINGNYISMFESTSSYHDDERLTKEENLIINSIYKKLGY